jgi:putative transposase
VVHSAGIQDRDGAALVLDRRTRALFPFIELIFADQGYQGEQAAAAARRSGTWRLEIVRRDPETKGFVVLPKRWIVERTFAWFGRCRRLAKSLPPRRRGTSRTTSEPLSPSFAWP